MSLSQPSRARCGERLLTSVSSVSSALSDALVAHANAVHSLAYYATSAENADLMSVLVYSATGLLNMASVSPSSTIFPFLMTMT